MTLGDISMEKIELKHIAGYATERTVWKLIEDMITNNPKCDAWDIGSMAFYAIMGVEVLEGKGRATQTATTPIPRINVSHCSPKLSTLIHQCLAFEPEERPTIEMLRREAEQALSIKPVAPSRLSTHTGKSYKRSLVSFWPEEFVVLLFLFLMSPLLSIAQNAMSVPQEMTEIVNRCVCLRSEKNYDNVIRAFSNDGQWTLMDELAIDYNGECTESDEVISLGLNRLACRIVRQHSGISNAGGRFRNGQDSRFKYSFIEVKSKKGASLNYDIIGREGRQIFAVLPSVADAKFDVVMTLNKKPVGNVEWKGGVAYVLINDTIKKSDLLHLTIVNKTGKNMSFVIVNYNSRIKGN